MPQSENNRVFNSAERIANAIGEAFYVWDIPSDTLEWSRGFLQFAGLPEDETRHLTGRGFETLLGAQSRDTRFGTVVTGVMAGKPDEPVPYQCVYSLRNTDAENPVWIEDNGCYYCDGDGRPARAEGSVRIITERRKREEELRRKSDFDDLTGLPNRRSLEQAIVKSVDASKQEGIVTVFMILSIERLDMINEIYGFESGDFVLKRAGEIIASKLRGRDTVCRFSGSKFGLILHNCPPAEIYDAGERLLNALSCEIMEAPGGHVSASGVIGACFLPKHAETTGQAFQTAFQAMKCARKDLQNRIGVYFADREQEQKSRKQARFSSEIVSALEEDRIKLSFQPVVRSGGDVAFHEALVRMEDRSGNVVAAQDFVELVENLGMIRMVDLRVLELVLETLRNYRDAVLSVNVSQDTVLDPLWLSNLATGLANIENGAQRLIVEMTESMAIVELAETKRFVENVKALGCRVAIDDFGAGFTSFSNLKDLPVDMIKLDGSYGLGITENEKNQAFVKALLSLAKVFGLETVVEWVEDEKSSLLLDDWEVDYQQGYRFGRALVTPPWKKMAEEAVEAGRKKIANA